MKKSTVCAMALLLMATVSLSIGAWSKTFTTITVYVDNQTQDVLGFAQPGEKTKVIYLQAPVEYKQRSSLRIPLLQEGTVKFFLKQKEGNVYYGIDRHTYENMPIIRQHGPYKVRLDSSVNEAADNYDITITITDLLE